MPTLILTPRYSEDSQQLRRAAERLGWGVERLHGWRVPEHLCTVDEPVLYLEALMAPMQAEEFGLRLQEPSDDWLPTLPEEYRLRTVRLLSMAEARSNSEPAFVKPPADKCFPAGVYRGSELPVDFAADMPVLVSEVVNWEKEFRCFLLDRRLRAMSVYLRRGELQAASGFVATKAEESEVREFVANITADGRVALPRAIVMDVGVIAERGWAVVELNAAWGSGLYGCDPFEVLEVLRHAAERS